MSHEEGYNFKYFICAWCKTVIENETKNPIMDPNIDPQKISSHGLCPKCSENMGIPTMAA